MPKGDDSYGRSGDGRVMLVVLAAPTAEAGLVRAEGAVAAVAGLEGCGAHGALGGRWLWQGCLAQAVGEDGRGSGQETSRWWSSLTDRIMSSDMRAAEQPPEADVR